MLVPRTNNFFDRFFNDSYLNLYDPFDIIEEKNKYLIHVDVPGMTKEDLKIDIKDGVLNIIGEKKLYNQTKSIKKSFTCPSDINIGKCEAKVENGLLRVELGKDKSGGNKNIIKIK